MEQKDVIQQVINTISKNILKNKEFMTSIMKNTQLTKENIDPNLILELMSKLNEKPEALPRPISNSPKERGGKNVVSKPVTIAQNSQSAQITSDLLEGNNVYLMGKAGTGKTYLAEAIANSVMGQETYMINCSQWTSPIEIRGGQTIKGYEEGTLIKAWANGGILILDELPKLDPNTAGLLNAALAETAAQPKYDDANNVIERTIPFITNGRGDKVYKGEGYPKGKVVPEDLKFRFGVIATGNTDMMSVGNKYGGNQRQDYSLVDRFAGSYYYLEANPIQEMKLTYPYVYNICNALRKFLDSKDALQSVSLRTMLNFNRTYEQEMLYTLTSPFADDIRDNDDNQIAPKTISKRRGNMVPAMQQTLLTKVET